MKKSPVINGGFFMCNSVCNFIFHILIDSSYIWNATHYI
nr:MAG TPA: hypothetical protein [Caudoviricetes sp.]